jgi:hypothetical protein
VQSAVCLSSRNYLFLLGLVLSNQAFSLSFDSNKDFRVIKESVLAEKCTSYLKTHRLYCSVVARRFFQVIDMKYKSSEKADSLHTMIFFESQTRKIFLDQRFLRYIERLNFELNQLHFSFSGEFDLFEFTAAFLNSKSEARKWIALLFQDNARLYHVNWLKEAKPMEQKLLEKYLQAYRHLMVDHASKVDFYPQGMSPHFSSKIYYYYLTAFLNREMDGIEYMVHGTWKEAKINELKRLAKATALMINLIYVYHHLYHSSLEMAFRDPVPLGKFTSEGKFISNGTLEKNGLDYERWMHRYKDLYMAYIASLPVGATAMDLPSFRKIFVENPLSALQYISYQF